MYNLFDLQLMKKKHNPSHKNQGSNIHIPNSPVIHDSQSILTKKPLPQIYSYNQIHHSNYVPQHFKGEKYPRSNQDIYQYDSQVSTGNKHYYSRIKKHGQYITQQCIPLLRERLRSIQEYYEILIGQQKTKNNEKSQIILEVIEQMQAIHNQKINEIKRLILQSEQQKKDVGFVDDKMNQIKGNIQELIEQSNILKVKNSELQTKIQRKRKDVRSKQNELQQLNRQLLEARGQLETFQINNLKNNKINRQIVQLFNSPSSLSEE